ncbi:CLUMA_CG000622, isoform A [Clunio marinus]|uniref:CLUMA_CG000622, isoform A n=1 Tax=Clunio marinus TaxID=568069 RepID=A0A1J1HFP2_9DIPT|nr:CLUMA_CG000622, isoform A [Clunio marinus]
MVGITKHMTIGFIDVKSRNNDCILHCTEELNSTNMLLIDETHTTNICSEDCECFSVSNALLNHQYSIEQLAKHQKHLSSP